MLVEQYRGTGIVKVTESNYPVEEINVGTVIGQSWVRSKGKYVDTTWIKIIYSGQGVHVVPINGYKRRDI